MDMEKKRIGIAMGISAATAALLLSAAGCPVSADCGSIPFQPEMKVFEPDQNALICWDGRTEILVLSTNLRADRDGAVLEVIPLPAKPRVTAADEKVFEKITAYINRKIPPKIVQGFGGGFGLGGGGTASVTEERVPAAKVVLHKKIGATDISILEVLKPPKFISWVDDHLRKQDVKNPSIPDPLKAVIEEYLEDGCHWFSFNVVRIGRRVRTKKPIQYCFRAGVLYYPLRITRSEHGRTKVKLLILTRELFDSRRFAGFRYHAISKLHRPITVQPHELKELHPPAARMFRGRVPRLRTWEIEGDLAGFTDDLIVGAPKQFCLQHAATETVYGPFPVRDGARVRIHRTVFRVICREDPPRAARNDRFMLRRVVNPVQFGPFAFIDGTDMKIGEQRFVLRMPRPRIRGR